MSDRTAAGPGNPSGGTLAGLEKQLWAREKRPPAPVEAWEPAREGNIDIRIARDGQWYHEGDPINRIGMVQLFATILRHDADGEYYLVTPAEKLRIEVEDAPFVAVEMKVDGQGRDQKLSFRTNLDDWVVADDRHPIQVEIDAGNGEPAPYVLVRAHLRALLTRSVFYDLVELGCHEVRDGKSRFGVWSCGTFFSFADSDGLEGN